MKIWIGTAGSEHTRRIYYKRPTVWLGELWEGDPTKRAVLCEFIVLRLLCGSGLRLPRHGSKELVEVELTAKKPKRRKK